jgi:EamA domain-containing membrane protein RarD
MISANLIFDVAPPLGGGIGVIVGIAFFLIFAAIAFVAYKMLRRTVKMAVRMTIVVAILLIALVGSIALLFLGSGGSHPTRPTPATQKQR